MIKQMVKKNEKVSKKPKNIVSFDDETVTKEVAEVIVRKENKKQVLVLADKKKSEIELGKKKTKLNKITNEANTKPVIKQKKRKIIEPSRVDKQNELNPKKPEIQTEESIRAKKRRKQADMLVNQKSKSELAMQEKCLSYLSLWKHNKREWKFEKLKQVWLVHSIFDDAKVPDEFFENLIEYFGGSKGKVRDKLLKAAVKLVDEEIEGTKYERARSIVQHLQE